MYEKRHIKSMLRKTDVTSSWKLKLKLYKQNGKIKLKIKTNK